MNIKSIGIGYLPTIASGLFILTLLNSFALPRIEKINDNPRLFGSVKSILQSSYKSNYSSTNDFVLVDSFKNKYDSLGRLIEWIDFKDPNIGVSEKKYLFSYDSNGKVSIFKSYFEVDTLDFKTIYQYNNNGKKIRSTTLNSRNQIYHIETYDYNWCENKCRWESLTRNVLNYYKIQRYDRRGNIVYWRGYNPDGKKTNEFYFKYDRNNNLVELCRKEYEVSLEYQIKYTYDSLGNCVETKTYTSDGNLKEKWSFTYFFDEKGNWVKQHQYKGGILKGIIYRKIQYYEP